MADKELLTKKIKELARDGKISCPQARKLAEEIGVQPREIGKACNEAGVKILGCELGCF